MKTIIIATDFSETAANATNYAAMLAAKLDAHLLIYHAYLYPLPPDVPSSKKRYDDAYNEDKNRMEVLSFDLKNRFDISLDYHLSPEPIMEELPRLVKEHHADLVVMGISGNNPVKRMVFGSTTISVLRIATYPIMVIPEEVTFIEPKRILFAFLPQILHKENTLSALKTISATFHSKIKVLRINHPEAPEAIESENKYHMDLLNEKLHKLDFSYLKVDAKNVIEGIEKGLEISKADMLVMVPGKYSIWKAVNKKSATRKITAYVQVPLLTLPNQI